ncbi:hypothetical protein LCGC14_2407500, partial [marine sediment metagenome]
MQYFTLPPSDSFKTADTVQPLCPKGFRSTYDDPLKTYKQCLGQLRQNAKMTEGVKMKTLVLVHPGSMFGSAEWAIGGKVQLYRNNIRRQILEHTGNFIVIDGFLSDEIDTEFEEAIHCGLCNAVTNANQAGPLDSVSAMRAWGCDGGESPFDEWESFGSVCLPSVFDGQGEAAEFLCKHLRTDVVEVTGAWATLHNRYGSVNHVAEVFRDGMPDVD